MAEITKHIEFPDVSFWQGMIDWRKMGSVVIIRAGQNVAIRGEVWPDLPERTTIK